jgi:SAM-dependent methyltransferase
MDDQASRSTAGPAVGEDSFDAYYFEHCCGRPYKRDDHWLSFFGAIGDRIVSAVQPRRVLDAGCAMGFLVEALRVRGVEAEGIDLSKYAIDHVHESVRQFCRQGSIVDELTERYDLIVTIEVLEHMPPPEGEAAIANFCRHTDDVLFSSTPGDYREPSHVNVRPPEHWAELFARHAFYRDVDFDASFVTPWAVRFRRSAEPLPRIVAGYERRFALLSTAERDARSFSVDIQRELARTLERVKEVEAEGDRARQTLDAERGRFESHVAMVERERAQLGASLEEMHGQLMGKILTVESLEAEGARLRVEADRAAHDLRNARETIHNMERSVFWRLRGVWAAVSRTMGRPT